MIDHWKKQSIDSYLDGLGKYYQDCSLTYFSSIGELDKMNDEQVQYLNENIDFKKIAGVSDKRVLQKTFQEKEKDNFSFYLIKSKKIDLNVQQLDDENYSLFMRLSEKFLNSKSKWKYLAPLNDLFARGYLINDLDKKFISDYYRNEKIDSEEKLEKWSILRFATKLNDAEKFEKAISKSRELFSILSFKMKRPISFNFPNLLGVANNAMQFYRESGDVILKAMQVFEVEEKILFLDKKKGTFKKKRQQFFENKPIQDKEFENIVSELFKEMK